MYVYNEEKLPVPGTSLYVCFTVHVHGFKIKDQQFRCLSFAVNI